MKAICGIIYFGKKHCLSDWEKEYANDRVISDRIKYYIDDYLYGMEITGLQKIQPITLDELRTNVTKFTAPQSYLLLENNEELKRYIEEKTVLIGDKIRNDLTGIFPEHICKRY